MWSKHANWIILLTYQCMYCILCVIVLFWQIILSFFYGTMNMINEPIFNTLYYYADITNIMHFKVFFRLWHLFRLLIENLCLDWCGSCIGTVVERRNQGSPLAILHFCRYICYFCKVGKGYINILSPLALHGELNLLEIIIGIYFTCERSDSEPEIKNKKNKKCIRLPIFMTFLLFFK